MNREQVLISGFKNTKERDSFVQTLLDNIPELQKTKHLAGVIYLEVTDEENISEMD